MSVRVVSVMELAESIPDGASVAVPRDASGSALELVRALVRRQARGLKLIAVPQVGLQADLLIGAGCVESVEAAAVSLGEHGQAPRFRSAVTEGSIAMRDSTCPAIHAGFQAGEKGIPFMPLRGIIGSDLVTHRADWKIIDNPFGADDDPILLLPAITPDVAVFHASISDRDGNVWVGSSRELLTMAHAARATLVTVEEIVDQSLLADQTRASGTLSGLYVTTIAVAPKGAWPVGLAGSYPPDHEHLRGYAEGRSHRGRLRAVPRRPCARSSVAGRIVTYRPEELLIAMIARWLEGTGHVAVGAVSPIPAAGALLAHTRSSEHMRVSLLGSTRYSSFTEGGRELFDCAAQGRIDAFFLGGLQIDGGANLNLVGTGPYPKSDVRLAGSFGSAYMYFMVPRVMLFSLEHTPQTLVERVDFISAPGTSPAGVYRPGGPVALLTERCLFEFDRHRARFRLASVHPGQTLADVTENTGFDFDHDADVPTSQVPDAAELDLIRNDVARAIGETYPAFAERLLERSVA